MRQYSRTTMTGYSDDVFTACMRQEKTTMTPAPSTLLPRQKERKQNRGTGWRRTGVTRPTFYRN